MYLQTPQYPFGFKYHTKKQYQAFISSKNSNNARKRLCFLFGESGSTQRLFSCCTLYKFVNSRVTAIKPNPVIQLFDAAAKTTTQHLDLKGDPGWARKKQIIGDTQWWQAETIMGGPRGGRQSSLWSLQEATGERSQNKSKLDSEEFPQEEGMWDAQ